MNRVQIIRRPGFVQINNTVVRCSRISLRARGCLAYLLSQPDEFELNTEEWAKENLELEAAYAPERQRKDGTTYRAELREGRDAIRMAMRELEAVGFLTRTRVQYENGQFGWLTTLDENALVEIACEQPEKTRDGLSVDGPNRQNSTKAHLKPATDLPATVNPSSNRNTKKELNTEYCSSNNSTVDNYVPRQPAIDKDQKLRKGLGCKPCDATGVIEESEGAYQCSACKGSGIAEPQRVPS